MPHVRWSCWVCNAAKARDGPWLARDIPRGVDEGRTCPTTSSCMAVLATVKIPMAGSVIHKYQGPSAVKAHQRQSQKKSTGEKDFFIENLPFYTLRESDKPSNAFLTCFFECCSFLCLLQLKFPSDQHWAVPDNGAQGSVSAVGQYLFVKGFQLPLKRCLHSTRMILMPRANHASATLCFGHQLSARVNVRICGNPEICCPSSHGTATCCAQTDLARCWLPSGWFRGLCTRLEQDNMCQDIYLPPNLNSQPWPKVNLGGNQAHGVLSQHKWTAHFQRPSSKGFRAGAAAVNSWEQRLRE